MTSDEFQQSTVVVVIRRWLQLSSIRVLFGRLRYACWRPNVIFYDDSFLLFVFIEWFQEDVRMTMTRG